MKSTLVEIATRARWHTGGSLNVHIHQDTCIRLLFATSCIFCSYFLSLFFFFSFFSYHFVPQSASSLESLIDGKALKRKKIYLLFQTPGELKILFRIINKRNVPNGSRKIFYYYIRFISFVDKNYIGIIYSKKKENKFIQIIK